MSNIELDLNLKNRMDIVKVLWFFLIVLILACGNYFTAVCQSKNDLEKRRNSILSDIEETENILNTTQHSKSESLEKLELLDHKINLRNSVVENLLTESKEVDKHIEELITMTEAIAKDIKSIKEEYGHMIYLAYLNRNRNSELMYILSAKDFNQAYKR